MLIVCDFIQVFVFTNHLKADKNNSELGLSATAVTVSFDHIHVTKLDVLIMT